MMKRKHKRIKHETVTAYLMIAPEVILMALFIFVPILYALYISLFERFNILGQSTYNRQICRNICNCCISAVSWSCRVCSFDPWK